ncbi:MAG TPA: MFS transporter [Candidatus Binatia bacterium]|nr:MFS transporter [Candidatus Binatia bacterium]
MRSRNFGPYFAGNAASASGTWFQNLAASIFVYRATHSPFLLGVLNFCQFAPVLALSPWAGAFADRHDRRRLLLVTQVASVLLSGGLAVLGWAGLARVWNVIACSAGLGVASAFAVPSQQSLIAALVQPDDVPQAVALNSMTFNLARAIGPASAAGVIAGLGIPWAFALNSGSYLALVAGLLAVRPREEERAERPSLRESFALLRADRRLTIALLVVMTAGFGSDPVNTEGPAFAHAFGYSETWAGAIVAFFGAGAVCAALLVAGRVVGSRRRMGLTLGALGAGIALFAVSPWLPLGFVFLALAGFGYLSSNTAATTRLQLGVPPSQRGRIMALWGIAFLGLRPVASLTDGAIAGALGVRVAGVVLAVPAALGAAVALRRRRI